MYVRLHGSSSCAAVAAFLQLLRRSREEDERAKKDMLLMLLYIESRGLDRRCLYLVNTVRAADQWLNESNGCV